MANSLPSNFPQVSLPFVAKDGRIEQAWLQFLVSLWNRTGQAGSGPITGLEVGTGLVETQSGSIVTVAFGNIDPGNLLANIALDEAAAVGISLTQYLDDVVSDNQGALLVRGADDWHSLEPGSDEQVLVTHGAMNDLDWETRGNGTLYNVTDGTNVVNGVTELLFNGNTFNVTDLGGGEAQIDEPGGGGGGGNGTVNEVSDGTNNLVNITEIYFNNTQFSVTANANPDIADVDALATSAGALVPIGPPITPALLDTEVDFVSLFTSAYDHYILEAVGIQATVNCNLNFQFGQGTTWNVGAANYYWGQAPSQNGNGNPVANAAGANTDTVITIFNGWGSGSFPTRCGNFTIHIFGPLNPTTDKWLVGLIACTNIVSPAAVGGQMQGQLLDVVNAYDGCRVLLTSGSFLASGYFQLYGVVK